MLPISIRPVKQKDIFVLNKYLSRSNRDIHQERYFKHEQGRGLYAIAWHSEKPVGNLYISWEGAEIEPVKSQFPDCAHLTDLYIQPEYRGNHIATQLLEYAEARACKKGYRRIGLDIGDLSYIGYRIAHNIYTKLGYVDGGLGRYTISYSIIDENGNENVIEEKVSFLLKELNPNEF